MRKAAKKNQTKNSGSSNRKGKNGNAGNAGNAKAEAEKPEQKNVVTRSAKTEEPKEKKRRGRAPSEGEPLKRVLIFLSEADVAALKAEVGDRGMSTRVREIIKEYLAKRA